MSVTPQDALSELQKARDELAALSDALHKVNLVLDGTGTEDGVEKQYQDFIDEHEVGQWLKSQEEDGPRLPSEALRIKLARREMPADLLARHDMLTRKRKRIQERMSGVAKIVEANRSILSALKEEAAGSGSSIRRAA